MRLNRSQVVCLLTIVITTSTLTTFALGQNRRRAVERRPLATPSVRDEIPPAALLTERGTQLADRLQALRAYEQTMGRRHPSRDAVRTEIVDIKRELAAWASGESNDTGPEIAVSQIPSMNDQDLRQLVLQLVGRINQLQRRVETLERKERRRL